MTRYELIIKILFKVLQLAFILYLTYSFVQFQKDKNVKKNLTGWAKRQHEFIEILSSVSFGRVWGVFWGICLILIVTSLSLSIFTSIFG